jgi:hypothetical protein
MAVPEFDLFSTPDLYEGKGPFQVVKCIHALGRTVQATMPEYTGPKLGVKMAEARVRGLGLLWVRFPPLSATVVLLLGVRRKHEGWMGGWYCHPVASVTGIPWCHGTSGGVESTGH